MGVSSIYMDGYGTIKKKADDTATANCVPCNEFAFPTCTVLCSHLRKTERKEINVLLYCEELNNRVLFKAISDKLDISRKMQHHLSLKEFKKKLVIIRNSSNNSNLYATISSYLTWIVFTQYSLYDTKINHLIHRFWSKFNRSCTDVNFIYIWLLLLVRKYHVSCISLVNRCPFYKIFKRNIKSYFFFSHIKNS